MVRLNRLQSAIPLLERAIAKLPPATKNNIAIAFPDDGAYKRFNTMIKDMPTIVCTKIRKGLERIVKVKDGMSNLLAICLQCTPMYIPLGVVRARNLCYTHMK